MGPLLRDSPPDEAVSLHGGLTVTRVMISGQLGGRLAKLRMSPVCKSASGTRSGGSDNLRRYIPVPRPRSTVPRVRAPRAATPPRRERRVDRPARRAEWPKRL